MKASSLRLGRGLQVVSVSRDPTAGKGVRLDDNGKLPSSLSRLNGVTGSVSSAGAIVSGTGFTVVHGGTGDYTVTFSPVLSSIPIFVATVVGANHLFATGATVTATSINISVQNDAGAFVDGAFNFLALIPQ